ncbi:MFS transporter [soil metagenome]
MTTTTTTAPLEAGGAKPPLTQGLVLLFAFCCGAIVSNIYYAQPLIELIAPDVGLSTHSASLIVSLTQVGYALGLLFLVPLGDLLENRSLMIATLIITIASLIGASMAAGPTTLLVFSILIGFSSVSVQMMVPIAAAMSDDATRGRVVGTVMSGLLFGVLLARPVASLIADHFGWRAVFGSAAVLMALIATMLGAVMPRRQPDVKARYPELLMSMGRLFRTRPMLRQRSFYQGCMFAALVLFWTAAPIELARHYGFTQTHIAFFALIGAAGAVGAPITGRLADAGYGRVATAIAMAASVVCFLPSAIYPALGVIGLVFTAIFLDIGVQTTLIVGQREVYALDANSRSRINGVYMTSIFVGGATGAALASVVYDGAGWTGIAVTGALLIAAALVKFLVDQRGQIGRQTT